MLEGPQKQTEHLKSSIWLSHLVTRNFFRQLTLWDNWGKKEAYKGCHFIPSATKGFISLNIFSRMAVAVHMHAKHFEFNILVYKKKLSSTLPNQLGKLVLTAGQFAHCLALKWYPSTITDHTGRQTYMKNHQSIPQIQAKNHRNNQIHLLYSCYPHHELGWHLA